MYSQKGYSYAIEKTDFTYGWTKPAVDEFANLGYVDELAYFVNCVLKDEQPMYGVDGAFGLKKPAALNAPQFLTSDVLAKPLALEGYQIEVPTGPGLGIQVDEDKVTDLVRRTKRMTRQ